MNQDIQSQLDRAKELLQELQNACSTDLQTQNVSGKTKNLSQEVLTKIKHLLDQSIYKFFEKYYLPNLSETDKKSTRVYFPIVSKKEDLNSVLGRAKMGDTEKDHPIFYKFIDSVQPYNQDYSWLKHLAHYSSEKHIRLTPQALKEENETTLGNSVHIGRGASVLMQGCFINDIPINSEDINTEPLENFDPRLEVQRVTWISFVFSDTDINILELCGKSIKDGEKIITQLLKFV